MLRRFQKEIAPDGQPLRGRWRERRGLKGQRGFTLMELLVVMGLMGVLLTLALVNLTQPQRTASIAGAVDTLVADLRSQQLKAMAGDSVSATSAQAHGIYVQSGSYTLYKGNSYSAGDTDNLVVQPQGVTLSTSLASSQVNFQKASGEPLGWSGAANTITVTSTSGGGSRTITINRYGVVTVN